MKTLAHSAYRGAATDLSTAAGEPEVIPAMGFSVMRRRTLSMVPLFRAPCGAAYAYKPETAQMQKAPTLLTRRSRRIFAHMQAFCLLFIKHYAIHTHQTHKAESYPMEDKQVQVNLRLPLSLKTAAEMAARQDHRSLTGLIEKLLAEYVKAQPGLDDWHERAIFRMLGIVADNQLNNHIKYGFFTRSYSINTKNGDSLSPYSLAKTLSGTYNSVQNVIFNPNFVFPFTNKPEFRPYFTADNKLSRGRTTEILKSAAWPDIFQLQYWRVSPAGLVTDICPYEEDYDKRQLRTQSPPGKWFCPFYMTRQLASMVLHASFFSEKFSSAETIEFRCEWQGLRERIIDDPDPNRMADATHRPVKMARADHRVTVGEWPAADLRKLWPEIVSALGGPVMRMFDEEFDYSASFVSSQKGWLAQR